MSDPASLEEFTRLFAQRSKISGLGMAVTMHIPCPFCAAKDFNVYRLMEVQENMDKEHTCGNCGRSMSTVVVKSEDGQQLSMTLYQTGGPDQPAWLEPKMPRAARPKPVDLPLEVSEAHKYNHQAMQFGVPTYRQAGDRRYRSCSYCGSAHPQDLAEAVRQGMRLGWADMKYGWPHKMYPEYGTPNPKDIIKFYSEHLVDATAEDRAVIQKAIGTWLNFLTGGGVEWGPVVD